jgi:radical SAM superfamily enzyme YgiQ (UPF0313 family)
LCSFCSNKQLKQSQSGSYVRFRSVDNVLEEINRVVSRYLPSEIYFQDDTFTLKGDFIEEFCRKYSHKFKIPFEFFSCISPSVIEILKKLRKVGGRRVSFGIESGSEDLRRKNLKKNFSNKEVIAVFKEAKKIGYQTEAFVMIGMPDETPQDFECTVKLLKKINPDLYSLSIYFPFKGTDLYYYAIKRGYLQDNFSIPHNFISRRDTLLKMPQFSRDEILKKARMLGLEIYKDKSLIKGILFTLYETKLGAGLLKIFFFCKRMLRNIIA